MKFLEIEQVAVFNRQCNPNDRKQKYRRQIKTEMISDDKTAGLINKFVDGRDGGG